MSIRKIDIRTIPSGVDPKEFLKSYVRDLEKTGMSKDNAIKYTRGTRIEGNDANPSIRKGNTFTSGTLIVSAGDPIDGFDLDEAITTAINAKPDHIGVLIDDLDQIKQPIGTILYIADCPRATATGGKSLGCPCYYDGDGWMRASDDRPVDLVRIPE